MAGYYATAEDIIELYGIDMLKKISDRNRDGQIDVDVVDMALQSADDLCNSYIGAYYPIPLSPVPGVVKTCAINVAVYYLAHERMGRTEEMRLRYEDALCTLKRISEGKMSIGVPGSTDGPTGTGGQNLPRKGKSINVGRA